LWKEEHSQVHFLTKNPEGGTKKGKGVRIGGKGDVLGVAHIRMLSLVQLSMMFYKGGKFLQRERCWRDLCTGAAAFETPCPWVNHLIKSGKENAGRRKDNSHALGES